MLLLSPSRARRPPICASPRLASSQPCDAPLSELMARPDCNHTARRGPPPSFMHILRRRAIPPDHDELPPLNAKSHNVSSALVSTGPAASLGAAAIRNLARMKCGGRIATWRDNPARSTEMAVRYGNPAGLDDSRPLWPKHAQFAASLLFLRDVGSKARSERGGGPARAGL